MKEVKIVTERDFPFPDTYHIIVNNIFVCSDTLKNCKTIRDAFVKIGYKDVSEDGL